MTKFLPAIADATENKSNSIKEHVNNADTWFQPVGDNWLPFLPGSIIPSDSLVVAWADQKSGEPPFVVVSSDPARLLVGKRTGGDCSTHSTQTITPSPTILFCKISYDEMKEEDSTELVGVQIGESVIHQSVVLDCPMKKDNITSWDLVLPTLSVRQSRIKEAGNYSQHPSSSAKHWFQPVRNNWHPFLPGSILPSDSMVVARAGQKLGEPPFVVVSSDPARLLVGKRTGGDCSTHSTQIITPFPTILLFCKISYDEMKEEDSTELVGVQIGEPVVHQSVVLDFPMKKDKVTSWDLMLPTLSVRQSRIIGAAAEEDDFPDSDNGQAWDEYDNDNQNLATPDPPVVEGPPDDGFDYNGFDSSKNDQHLQPDHLKDTSSDQNSKTELDGCVPSLSTMRRKHLSPGGQTLELPFSFSHQNKEENQPGWKPQPHSNKGRRRSNRLDPAIQQEKEKVEEDQKKAKAHWRSLFGDEGQCAPINLEEQYQKLKNLGLTRESFQSLTDPDKGVRGDVIDKFLEMLGHQHAASKNGFVSSVVVPTFMDGTEDQKEKRASEKDGAYL